MGTKQLRRGEKIGPQCNPPGAKADPIIRFIYVQLVVEKITRAELARVSGVPAASIYEWWVGASTPNIVQARNMLQVLGYGLKATELEEGL